MDQTAHDRAPPAADRLAPKADALDRLTGLGPRGGLQAIIAGLAVSFFALGYFVVYWRNADMDFMVIYNAFAMNDGKPQQFFDHPAYLTILSVKTWFQLLHGLGLLDAYRLSAIPSATDPAAFDAAMTQAVRAGRLLAWITATGFVLIFAALMRRIASDWRVALLATFAFAFSGGVAVHLRILRSEMIAASFVVFALMLLIVAGRRATSWRPLVIAAAAALCMLGLENKVHALLLIAALPLLALPFGGAESSSTSFWRRPAGWCAAGALAIAAVLAIWAAAPIVAAGLDLATIQAAGLKPVLGRPGAYQTVLLVWIAAAIVAYAVIWRISAAECVATMCAVAAGAAVALLALDLSYDIGNVVVVINPLEKMLNYADPATATATSGGIFGIVLLLGDGLLQELARLTFVLHSSSRPAVFLTWLIIPGIVVAWRRGEHQAALQALLFMLMALGIDTLGIRRGLKVEYFVFTDPLIILAGVVLLERLPEVRRQRWAYPIGAVLMALHIVISHSEPMLYVTKKRGPEGICDWNASFLPLLPLPWCANPPPHA